MILGFSTKINNKPNFFVDKIWSGLIDQKLSSIATCRYFENKREGITPNEFAIVPHYEPKIHTIRVDVNNRWNENRKIDFFINVRTKLMFQFAPKQRVVSVQNIEIEYLNNTGKWFKDAVVSIDESYIGRDEIEIISKNDGFDSVEDFFEYFNKNFKGKIIHWTNCRY